MFFKGRITIDPSQLTKIKVEKPEGAFKQMLFHITGGSKGEKIEVETLNAVAVVQSLHKCFSGIGVDNIIRLNHDDLEIYFDNKGIKDDLSLAVDKYSIEIDHSMSTYFNTLWMVKEYEDNTFKYLIETSVNRSHRVNEYPIEIIVSGLLREYQGQDKEALKAKMQHNFSSQDQYDHFIQVHQAKFEGFLSSIAFEMKKHMRIDDVRIQTKKRMLVQREKAGKPRETHTPQYGGAPYSYFGFSDFLMYSFLWSQLSFDNHLHVADVEVINEAGDMFADIGEAGLELGEGTIFDESIATEDLGDLASGSLEELDKVGEGGFFDSMGDADGGGWFDSLGDGFDFDIDI
ncbi:MAG: hypothetical protein ACOCVN_00590 [bacterium]